MSLIKEHRFGMSTVATTYRVNVAFPGEDPNSESYGTLFNIEHIHHNGYTKIKAMTRAGKDEFGGWINLFNTRFQANIPTNVLTRRRKVTKWALKTIEQAYATWLREAPPTNNDKEE